jgi:hypothetical protein
VCGLIIHFERHTQRIGLLHRMAGSGVGFMHIPDEWGRETPKNSAKTGGRVASNTNPTVPGTSDTVSHASTVTPEENKAQDTTKKRRRVKASPISSPEEDVSKATDDEAMHIADQTPISTSLQTPSTTSMSSSSRHCDETQSVMRGLFYQVEKLARRSGCALEDGIHLDSIMTHIPYIDVLQQMFGGNAAKDSPCVPVVTRAYEESYMREAISGIESNCVMGSNCECQFIDEHNPFIGVKFTLPIEAFSDASLSSSVVEELSSNRLCVLCCRKNTQSLFYEALYNHRAYNACIQLYGNICDRPGEYSKEAMLICPLSGPIHNMPLPVVAHQRNRYSVVVHNGIRQLRQHRVSYEDFHVPSSSRC